MDKEVKPAAEPKTKKGYAIFITADPGANQVLKPSGVKAKKGDKATVEWVWFRTNREGAGAHLFKSKTEAAPVVKLVGGDVREMEVPLKDVGSTITKG